MNKFYNIILLDDSYIKVNFEQENKKLSVDARCIYNNLII